MSGGGKTQTSTTDTSPWKEQQPYLKQGFEQAYQLSQKPSTQYQGAFTAGKTASDIGAENYLTGYAGTLTGQSGKNLDALNWATGAGNLDVGNNQYVQGQMAANTNRLYQDFNEQTVPALRSNFGKSGQIGSSRQGIAEGLAAQGVARAAADSNAQIQGTAYNNALDTYSTVLGQAPALMQAGTMPGTLLSQVGQSQRGFEQDKIDEAISRNDFSQNEEWNRLANYMQMVSGNWGGTTTSTMPKGGNKLAGALGGALTGFAMGGPLGALAGGAGGLLMN
jgi:hypothetical protein